MAMVLLALAPGIVICGICFGPGKLMQIFLALAFALAFEAIMLKLRAQPMARFLTDLSAPVTAVLFALLIPPSAPWWIAAIGIGVAIVIAKHLYGGLGRNLFNPAMAGLAAAWLFFPHELEASSSVIGETQNTAFAGFAARSGEWLAIAYALGGLFLLWKKIIPWQTPFATLSAAALMSLSFIAYDANAKSILLESVVPGVWILGAFFIATDPVTGCISPRGRLLFGAGVGTFGALIGRWDGGAAGLAFAVLLMNCLAPWIDRHTRSRLQKVSQS